MSRSELFRLKIQRGESLKYGCHNREPLNDTAIVQNGWYEYTHHSLYSRRAVYKTIPDNMSKECVYQRDKKDDPKCQGCKELKL